MWILSQKGILYNVDQLSMIGISDGYIRAADINDKKDGVSYPLGVYESPDRAKMIMGQITMWLNNGSSPLAGKVFEMPEE